MISLVEDGASAENLLANIHDSHCKRKIASLVKAYTVNCGFLELYRLSTGCGKTAAACVFDKASVIVTDGLDDYTEACAFLNGFPSAVSDIKISKEQRKLYEAVFCSWGEKNPLVDGNPRLESVFRVISSVFGEISFDEWYVDMSHRIRHGVSRAFLLDYSAACVQFDENGYVYISQAATMPESQNKGLCKSLLRHIASVYPNKTLYLHAEQEKIPLYEKIGFKPTGKVIYVK